LNIDAAFGLVFTCSCKGGYAPPESSDVYGMAFSWIHCFLKGCYAETANLSTLYANTLDGADVLSKLEDETKTLKLA